MIFEPPGDGGQREEMKAVKKDDEVYVVAGAVIVPVQAEERHGLQCGKTRKLGKVMRDVIQETVDRIAVAGCLDRLKPGYSGDSADDIFLSEGKHEIEFAAAAHRLA